MVHIVRSILRGRGGKKVFLVHFVASDEFDLYAFLLKYAGKNNLRQKPRKGDVQTIEVKIAQSRLRRLLEEIPRGIQFAYEQKEPSR
jgi:hypothetical protein